MWLNHTTVFGKIWPCCPLWSNFMSHNLPQKSHKTRLLSVSYNVTHLNFFVVGHLISQHAASDHVLPRFHPRHGHPWQGRHHQHLQCGRTGSRALPCSLQCHSALHLSSHPGFSSRIQWIRGRYPGSKKPNQTKGCQKRKVCFILDIPYNVSWEISALHLVYFIYTVWKNEKFNWQFVLSWIATILLFYCFHNKVDPGQIDSATTKCKFSQSTLLAPSPANFVNSAIRTLGYTNR